jgi:ribosomal protein S18 acetylase RimI-like enzyme
LGDRLCESVAMARLDVVPFSDEYLEDAGRLLAARHARQRESEPLLPARFEEPEAARDELVASWRVEGASGAAAFRNGRLVGYLIAAPRDVELWAENVWIEAAGHAVEEAEDIRDLYAAAATKWLEQERPRHYALVPSTDTELVDAWFRLGFGHQQAHGLREVPAHVDVRIPDGFEIREPREDDIEALLAVDIALPAHQRSSPVFSERPMPTADALREEWRSTLAGGEEKVLIGCLAGRPVACWSVCAADRSSQLSGLARPDGACYLAFASTLPEIRRSGIGVALTDASLAAAAKEGYAAIVTDWRMTNLLASRFWPKRGFRTVFFRLYRSIP